MRLEKPQGLHNRLGSLNSTSCNALYFYVQGQQPKRCMYGIQGFEEEEAMVEVDEGER